jgi:hypothetical protein
MSFKNIKETKPLKKDLYESRRVNQNWGLPIELKKKQS